MPPKGGEEEERSHEEKGHKNREGQGRRRRTHKQMGARYFFKI